MSQLQLLEYQDTWPSQFQQVAAELLAVFAANDVALEHIGSTAVPGLCAKPVLDVLLGVSDLREAEDRQDELAKLGYTYRPEYEDQLPERRYFVRPQSRTPRVHLHCVIREGRHWKQHMAFRNLLRESPIVRAEYADLKRSLAIQYPENKLAYTEAKAPFIMRVLAAAPGAA